MEEVGEFVVSVVGRRLGWKEVRDAIFVVIVVIVLGVVVYYWMDCR